MKSLIVMIGLIIPLREKIGNYDSMVLMSSFAGIIPLREKIGNYDDNRGFKSFDKLYHYERKLGTTTLWFS